MTRVITLRQKITVGVSALVCITMLLVAAVAIRFFEDRLKDSIFQHQSAIASTLAHDIDDKLQNTHDIIIALARIIPPSLINDPAGATRFLNNRAESIETFDNGIFLFTDIGTMVSEAPFPKVRTGKDFSFREYFRKTVETGKPYISDVYISSQAHHHPAVMFTAPVRRADGSMAGVIAGSIDLMKDNFLGSLPEMRIGRTGYVALFSADRTMIIHADRQRIMKQDIPEGANILLDRSVAGEDVTGETINSRGIPLIATYRHLARKPNWILSVSLPAAEAFEPVDVAKRTFVFGTVAITALVVLFVSLLLRRITEPLRLFTRHVEELPGKTGDERFVRPGRSDEIGLLADAFDRMIEEVDRQQGAIEAEKEQLAVTLRSIGDAVITTDAEGRVVMLNRVAEELTGWTNDDARLVPIEDVFPVIDGRTGTPVANPVRVVLESGHTAMLQQHTVLLSRDGYRRVIDDSASPIMDRTSTMTGAVLVFRDITEKLRMQEELTNSEKLESVGLLAGGIAHDFNNILTAILGRISLCRLQTEPGGRLDGNLDKAEQACQEARSLTNQLLTFSKGGAPVKTTADIAEVITDSAEFALRGSNVGIRFEMPAGGLPPVDIDISQMHRVIHNLVINAEQAMPDGGMITITAASVVLGGADRPPLHAGRYVAITLMDTGRGIPKEHISRVFDPYFTTKARGCGLGLAASYSIIRNHGGHITVESEPGKGTAFTIYLPASDRQVERADERHDPVGDGQGTILVMDDEQNVRELLVDMLDSLGYRADASSDGSGMLAAWRRAREAGTPYDAVIMDLTIQGGMGGRDAVKCLLELDPSARAIVSSGYSTDPIMANFRDYGFRGVIMKPYRATDLARVLGDVLRHDTL